MKYSFATFAVDLELRSLLSEDVINWKEIYARYYSELPQYIGELIIESHTNSAARRLVQVLHGIFTWREEYWFNWEIDGTASTMFGSFQYPSLAALMERSEDLDRPTEEPQEVVGPEGNGCDWGDYNWSTVRIYDLKMS